MQRGNGLSNKILIITGCTASGKSAFALEYAHKNNGVIINADALQQYQQLPILSAQPLDYQGISHELYGYLPPDAISNAHDWCKKAVDAINNAQKIGKNPIIVGGTGMYIKSLIAGLSPIPFVATNHDYTESTQQLYEKLFAIDKKWALSIMPQDRQRIIRGLNVFAATNKTLSDWHLVPKIPYITQEYDIKNIEMPTDILRTRIRQRLNQDFDNMVAEMAEFVKKFPNITENSPIMKIIGAKLLWQYHHQLRDLSNIQAEIFNQTCQYAKRQRTWFRHQLKSP